MKEYIDDCVNCPSETGCYGACKYRGAAKICDECHGDYAEYVIDGKDYCEDCAANLIIDYMHGMTVDEICANIYDLCYLFEMDCRRAYWD